MGAPYGRGIIFPLRKSPNFIFLSEQMALLKQQ